MTRLTEIREALRSLVSEQVQWPTKVMIGPYKLIGADEDLVLALRVLIDDKAPEDAEEILDGLFDQVPDIIKLDPTLGGAVSDAAVTACSGHRAFGDGQSGPPMLGAEWTVKVMV